MFRGKTIFNVSKRSEFAINSHHSIRKTTSYINFSISIIFIAFFIDPILFANVTFEGLLGS
jgi:hypothetical protein